MSLSPMSHVEFKKCPRHAADFRGQEPLGWWSLGDGQVKLSRLALEQMLRPIGTSPGRRAASLYNRKGASVDKCSNSTGNTGFTNSPNGPGKKAEWTILMLMVYMCIPGVVLSWV